MRLFLLLSVVLVAVACVAAYSTCYSKIKGSLRKFDGRSTRVAMPCKTWALRRQQCGDFVLTLSPGLAFYYPKYQVDTIWLGINNTKENWYWEGRTTNKIAVKYLNTEGEKPLFNKRDGSVTTNSQLEFGREEGVGVFVRPKGDNGTSFKVTITPWDPFRRSEFPNSAWKFECFDASAELNPYSKNQMCGGSTKREILTKAKDDPWNLPDRFAFNVVYYDTLTNDEIVQTNPQCTQATNILLNTCQSDEQRRNVINNCVPILENERHTQCVTNYNCSPMDVFNACLQWGCNGTVGFENENEEDCKVLAEGIDFCNHISNSGNLTERVLAAKCYKDFISISTDVA